MQSTPSPSRGAPRSLREDSRPQAATRPTKEQIALLMAMWAQNKPDSLCQREALARRTARHKAEVERLIIDLEASSNEKGGKAPQAEDKIVPDEDTGAALLDCNDMIMSVAGSGATHAAAYLCTRFPQQASGGTICLSKRPCSFCTKLMIQRGVRRIIVPELRHTAAGTVETITAACYDEYGRPMSKKQQGDKFQVRVYKLWLGEEELGEELELGPREHSREHYFDVAFKVPAGPGVYKAVLLKSGKVVDTEQWMVSGTTTGATTSPDDRSWIRLDEREYCEEEPFKPSTEAHKPNIEERTTFLNRLLQRGNTAFSTLDLPRYHQDVFDKLFNYYNGAFISIDKNGALNKAQTKREKERSATAWLMGLGILASLRSQDENAKVGAVLARTSVPQEKTPQQAAGCNFPNNKSRREEEEEEAKRAQEYDYERSPAKKKRVWADATEPEMEAGRASFERSYLDEEDDEEQDDDELPEEQFRIEIFGVGYNGPKKDSLHRDFVQGDGDKGKWVVHAEQNLLLFRCIDDVSQCELYSTHSPCIQCSGLVRAMGIKKVRYLLPYRPPIDLHSDRRAVQFVDDVLLGLVEAQAEQVSRRLFQGEGSQQDSQYCKL